MEVLKKTKKITSNGIILGIGLEENLLVRESPHIGIQQRVKFNVTKAIVLVALISCTETLSVCDVEVVDSLYSLAATCKWWFLIAWNTL